MKKIIVMSLLILILLFFVFLKKDYRPKQNKDNNKPSQILKTTIKKEDNVMDGITLNYHASIRINKNNSVIYFDPYKIAESLNDADFIFITHSHYDHYSEDDIKKVMNENTKFIVTSDLEQKIKSLNVSSNNITIVYPDSEYTVSGLKIKTVAAYNTDKTYHKKSYNWIGYNVLIDGNYYYVTGDSSATDEMKNVKCDVIFIPIDGIYTMSYNDALNIVNLIKPKVAVPIHYDETNTSMYKDKFINGLDSDIKGVILK